MAAPLTHKRVVSRMHGANSYVWGNGCTAWSLMDLLEMGIKEEWMPSGTSEMVHKHEKSVQFFYILDGEAAMEIEGNRYVLKVGDGIMIQSGEWHRISCEQATGVKFLVVSCPNISGDRINKEYATSLSE